MRKALLISVAVLLVFCSAISGCAKPAPAPVSAPEPAHETVVLEIYSTDFGKAAYVLSFALSEIINNNSEWLRAVAIETPGSAANMQILQRDPGKAGVWVGFLNPISIHNGRIGQPPFTPEQPFTMGVKAVSVTTNTGAVLVTTNPDIKKPEDLVGKTVALEAEGHTMELWPRFCLETWGIYDKVKIVTMSMGAQTDALIDGTIDVGTSGAVMLEPTEEFSDWVPIPIFERVLASREAWVIPFTPEDAAQIRERTGYPIYSIGGKGKTVGKSTLPDWRGLWLSQGWFVSEDMPDEVVTELVRIIYENAELFRTYHANGQAISKESIGAIAIPRDSFHPAAVKFLESKGVKVGL